MPLLVKKRRKPYLFVGKGAADFNFKNGFGERRQPYTGREEREKEELEKVGNWYQTLSGKNWVVRSS